MQYATESKINFIVYDQYGDPSTSIQWSRSYVKISKDGGNFQNCTNTPSSLGSGWYCLTLTASETTCDTFIIQFTPYPNNLVVQPIIGEPQRVSSGGGATAQEVWEYNDRTLTSSPTDISGLATASDLNQVKALAGNFSVSGNVLTAYNADGTTNAVYDLTRDQSGNITAIEPRSAT